MTALETLQKYGLKTDVKSIRERLDTVLSWDCNAYSIYTDSKEVYTADLSLLCSLAEKGERYEKAVKDYQDMLVTLEHGMFSVPELIRAFKYIIAEAEGETK